MSDTTPKTSLVWRVVDTTGFDSLQLSHESVPEQLGDHDCLIKIEAASLNYRDLMIPKGTYPFPLALPRIPGSDAAGTILAVGSRVTRFAPDDSVCTTLNQDHLSGPPTPAALSASLGGTLDGVFRQHAVLPEWGLVRAPSNLTFIEASTLSCAGVTAWNALYGLEGRPLKAGDTVLALGSGGVSCFVIQLAKAAGARVIATTSSAAKGERLRALGADEIVNYREDKEWGETVKKLTSGEGVDFVVEVGGARTMPQSLKALKMDGVMAVVGAVGAEGGEKEPGLLQAWYNTCIVRGVAVGSRAQLEDTVKAIEVKDIKPMVDEKVFRLEELKEAYQYLEDQKHFGKVVIDCQ